MPIDFSIAAEDYAAARPPFDARLYPRLAQLGVGLPGERLLDIGAGTGLLGRGFESCDVIEAEPSLSLLNHSIARHRVATVAESLPFPDATFDAVTAGQSWHWFDRLAAPREIRRVLKPAGRLAIVYQTPIPVPGNLAHASEQLILRFRPHWRHAGNTGINGQALKDLTLGGFSRIESFTFDTTLTFTPGSWHAYTRTTSAVAPTLTPAELADFDRQHRQMLASWPHHFTALHRVFAAIGTRD